MSRVPARFCLLALLLAPATGRGDPPPAPEAKVAKKPAGTFSIGAGYGTLEGFIGSASVAHGRLFGAEGVKLSLDARLSAHRSDAQLLFGLDQGRIAPYFFELGVHHRGRSLSPGAMAVEGMDTGGHIKVGAEIAPGLRLALGYRVGWLTLDQGQHLVGSGLILPPALQQEGGLLAAPFAEMTYKTGPGWDPESALPLGFSFSARAQHSSHWTGSDFKYTKLDLSAQYGLTLPLGMGLHTSLRAGALFGNPGQIPLFSRYRMGAPLSGSTALPLMGPVHRPGGMTYSLGGTGMAQSQITLHVPLIRRHLYAVAGLEAGAVFSPDVPGQPAVSADMAGILGLRWLSPIGPLSAGVGLPFNLGNRRDARPRFMFMLGGTF